MSIELLEKAARIAEGGAREDAVALLLPYLDKNPDDPRALFLLGFCFMGADKIGLSYQMFKRATELEPREAASWHNLGKCYHEAHRTEDAENCFRRALRLNPQFVNSLNGMGLVSVHRGDYDKAIGYSDAALKLEPASLDAKLNKGMAKLALGQWREGWRDYNENIGIYKDRKQLQYTLKNGRDLKWDGTKGLDIVCFGEQGIGDELSFASCLPDLIRDSKYVTVECDKRLEGLFKRSFPDAEVHGTRYKESRTWSETRNFDTSVAIGALPQFYRNADTDFPGTPYLKADPSLRLQWRALFDSIGPEPKVGIAWNGGQWHTNKLNRSVTLETLLPILKQKAHFVSLEYSDPRDDIEAFEREHGIKIHYWPHGTQIYDYDVTAALVAELDLVISVTTTVVHLAGGLGKECWCLVPYRVMWRYLTSGTWFPWAKSVELYRQRSEGWPVNELAAKLAERCSVKNT